MDKIRAVVHNLQETINKNPSRIEEILGFVNGRLQNSSIRDRFYAIWSQETPKEYKDILGKSLENKVGNWSVPKQTVMDQDENIITAPRKVVDTGGDQITRPTKVKADEEVKNNTYINRKNQEPYIEKMLEIKAPDEIKRKGKIIFLAGSIDMGTAEDWQSKVANELKDEDVTILNPRRDDWDKNWVQDIENPQFKEQVEWELDGQEQADIIAMHFSKDSKAPISLLELGLFADTGKMIVYCPEGFYRKGNVDIVCKKYGIKVVENFDEFINEIKKKLDQKIEKQKNKIERSFNPEMDETEFYKMVDDLLLITEPDLQKAHLHKPEEKLPLGSKKLAEQCELELYQNLRDRLSGWFDQVEKNSDPDEVISDLKMSLYNWAKYEKSQVRDSLQQLYNRGLEAGMRSTGILITPQVKKIDYIIYRDSGISPAINRFRDETFDNVAKIIRKHYTSDIGIPLYKTRREIDSWLHKQRFQTRRMLKTETARTANWGLLKAWNEDPDKYKFKYYWQSVIDNRTKDISKMRYENNPYSFDECKFLWEHQIQKMGKELVNDSFSQRCYLSREPIDYEFKSNRFYGQEYNYRRTLPPT